MSPYPCSELSKKLLEGTKTRKRKHVKLACAGNTAAERQIWIKTSEDDWSTVQNHLKAPLFARGAAGRTRIDIKSSSISDVDFCRGRGFARGHGNSRDAPTSWQTPWIEISPPSPLTSKFNAPDQTSKWNQGREALKRSKTSIRVLKENSEAGRSRDGAGESPRVASFRKTLLLALWCKVWRSQEISPVRQSGSTFKAAGLLVNSFISSLRVFCPHWHIHH